MVRLLVEDGWVVGLDVVEELHKPGYISVRIVFSYIKCPYDPLIRGILRWMSRGQEKHGP